MSRIPERPAAHPRRRARAALGAALTLALSTQAVAVSLNPDGQGQVLLFPYYTVNGGLVTVMSLTNHSDRVKAVKVRYREAHGGKDALHFSVYLSPYDQWTAALHDGGEADGPALLVSDDTSCLVPAQLPGGGQPFSNAQFSGPFADDGPSGLDRTRDGLIEVIEMGVVGDAQGAEPSELATAATHNLALLDESGRVLPNDCAKLRAAWQTGGVWREGDNADDDVAPPSGGLSGWAAIVDVAQGIAYPFPATALQGFYDRPDLAASPLHTGQGDPRPNLSDAEDTIAEPGGGTATALIVSGNETQSFAFSEARHRAVSALFMKASLIGEFNSSPAMGASTEWVLSFPTRAAHLASEGDLLLPFTQEYPGCVGMDFRFGGRDGERGGRDELGCVGLCPPDVLPPPQACGSSAIVAINQTPDLVTEVLRAPADRVLAQSLCDGLSEFNLDCPAGPGLHQGWLELQLGNLDERGFGLRGFEFEQPGFSVDGLSNFLIGDIANVDGSFPLLAGLPVLGLSISNFVNEQVMPGVLANYATLQPVSGRRFAAPTQGVDEFGTPIPVEPGPSP